MNGRPWDQNELNILALCQDNSISQEFCAKQVRRTRSAVKSKASERGLLQPSLGKWSAEDERQMYEMIAFGDTIQKVSEVIGRTEPAIKNYMARIGMSCASIRLGANYAPAK